MKTKILSAAALSTALAASLVMSGTAFANTLELNHGLKVGAQIGAQSNRGDNEDRVTPNANVTTNVSGKIEKDNDNDNDGNRGEDKHATSTHATSTKSFIKSLIQGNGQPVIGGTVSAVNGNTITVFTAAGVTYTVNATSSAVVKGNATTTASNIAVGDRVLVQGAVNGTSITANTIIDSAVGTSTTNGSEGAKKGWGFGHLKGFFSALFGFFK